MTTTSVMASFKLVTQMKQRHKQGWTNSAIINIYMYMEHNKETNTAKYSKQVNIMT
jgi:hypothetical protein